VFDLIHPDPKRVAADAERRTGELRGVATAAAPGVQRIRYLSGER
jgi:hypothetical protein